MRRFFAIILPIFLFIFLLGCTSDSSSIQNEQTNDTTPEDIVVAETNTDDVKEEESSKQPLQHDNETVEELDGLTVYYLDVGQADATVFQYKDGKKDYTILFDVGDWRGKEVVQFLHEKEIDHIDLIIISHPHADHIGQLAEIMNQFSVDEVWMSGNSANTNVYEEAVEAILATEADYDEPRAGDEYDVGPLQITILHPSSLTGGLNEDSISARFTYGDVSFVFTGDAYKEQERKILQRELHLEATFLQLGHHGSNTSSDIQFIKRVSPTYAIYSAGTNNSYGHPHEEIVSLMDEMDITLYGTDVHGTIIVTTDGVSYDIKTEAEGTIQAGETTSVKQREKKAKKKQTLNPDDSKTTHCIDINKASAQELMEIVHIGEIRAEELIEQRPFQSVEDLTRISGIGPARIADIVEENKACVK